MPIPQFPGAGISTLNDVINYVIRLERELRFLMEGGLDSSNMFEVGGWRVKPYQFAYKDNMVGMSSAGTAATSIRFWAGSADPTTAPFRVQHDGTIYSTKGFIGGWTIGATSLSGSGILEGGTVRTAASGQRIEISNNSLKTFNASDQLQGFAWGSDVSGNTWGDSFLYSGGNKLVEFYDTGTSYTIRGTTASTGLGIGGNVTTYGLGTWVFSSSGSADMQGTFTVQSGTAFNTVSQADSTATDVAGIVADFNTLLANLRAINILV